MQMHPPALSRKLLFVSGAWLSLAAAADAAADADVGLQPSTDARTVEFTTDEGTWISLDVTPDGRHLIFELLGDLYQLPIQGGTAQRITQGVAYDAQPRVSPDGRSIAFVSDRSGADQLWIARIDGIGITDAPTLILCSILFPPKPGGPFHDIASQLANPTHSPSPADIRSSPAHAFRPGYRVDQQLRAHL